MKKLFLIIILFGKLAMADEIEDFGGTMGAIMCGGSNKIEVASFCYYQGRISARILDKQIGSCEFSRSLYELVRRRIQKNELSEYVTSEGLSQAFEFSEKVCGTNGYLNASEGKSYFAIANNIVYAQGKAVAASEKPPTTKEEIVLFIAMKVVEKEGARTIENLSNQITKERLIQQLNEWLNKPKESLCRGDLTRGDLGQILKPILDCN